MNEFLSIFFTMILVDNFVLTRFLGICPFLGVSKSLESSMGMSMAVTFVMVMATAVTWPIEHYLLTPASGAWDFQYLQTIVFILVIAILVQLVELLMKQLVPLLYEALGIYLPLITTNCAILAVTILNIDAGYTFVQSIISSFGTGMGFMVAMILFSFVRGRVEEADPPPCFQGMPITLVSASIVSLSFMGFGGVVDGLFGG